MSSKLPQHWIICRLADVIDASALSDTADPSEIPSDAWVLELDDIEKDTSVILARRTFADVASKSAKLRFRPGDVLYGRLRPYLRKVVEADGAGYCSTEILAFRPSQALHGRYLFYWLKHPSFVDYTERASHGLNMPRLGKQQALATAIPVPPVAEQKRIADKLDIRFARSDAGRHSLRRAADLIEQFRTAILESAVSGELTATWRGGAAPDWPFVALGELADIQSGVTKNAKAYGATDEEIPYLRVANVQRGYLDLSDIRTIRVPRERIASWLLQPGDILYTEGGDFDKLGRGWIWEGQLPRCAFQNHVFRARLKDPHNQPKYISWWSNTRGAAYFRDHAKQTTNLASINQGVLRALPLAVPPPSEQLEIIRRVEDLQATADELASRIAAASLTIGQLLDGALIDAFSGHLVPPEADDKPIVAALAAWERERASRPATARRPQRRKSNMINSEELLAQIDALPNKAVSFDEIRTAISADYDSLRDALFELLAEEPPRLRQIFDEKAKAIRFVRAEA